MPVQWIYKLNESNSRNHKEDVIKQVISAHKLGDETAKQFLTGAYSAYNMLTYNFKQVPTTEGLTGRSNDWSKLWTLVDQLYKRELTGNAALDAVDALSQEFDSDQWNDFARNIILKDLRVGATIKTFNKFLKGTEFYIPVFECQLATDSEKQKKKLTGVKFLQRKLDGVRALVIVRNGQATIFSRNGKEFNNFDHVVDNVKKLDKLIREAVGFDEYVLDGEVMSDNFQALMKQAHRKHGADASDSVYHIFDILALSAFYKGKSLMDQHSRFKMLDTIKEAVNHSNNFPSLHIEDYLQVDLSLTQGHDVMRRYANNVVKEGFEGIMIKDADAHYECKRTTKWLKWKPVITVDLTVVGIEEGTGRNEGRVGALVCKGVDRGKEIEVNVGSGLNDDDRISFWNNQDEVIGQVIEVKADAVTQNQDGTYSLRFPRFVRFRGFEPGEKF